MRNILITLSFCLFSIVAKSQDTSVENSTFGIQTGFLGIWVHNEYKLTNQIALRSEVGLDAGIYGSDVYGKSGFFMVPAITLEPRWYYNLEKRVHKSRRIDGNSGNFLAIKTTIHPDIVLFDSNDNINFVPDISIIPTWGIRRNMGRHFTYEAGIGIGYVHFFNKKNTIILDEPDIIINLHLRLGYRF